MDITPADKDKKIIRFALWYARKKLAEGRNKDQISRDMKYCGNPVIRQLMEKIINGLDEIKSEPQRNRTRELVEFFMWVLYKDTAYRQPFFYILKSILDNQKEIFKDLDKYVVKPGKWYVNNWHESVKITEKHQKNGKITSNELSHAELIYVPSQQNLKFKKYYEEMEKQRKKWW